MNVRRGYTLIELMVVLVIISSFTLVAVKLPQSRIQHERQAQLQAQILMLRQAVESYKRDTGLVPVALADLAARSAPSTGYSLVSGTVVSLDAGYWKGPYIVQIPNDPVSGLPFRYVNGIITSSATGNDSQGVAFSTY